MATYLQGVQDYIPQLQPFQPDLNLYANVLQTKQTQYDSAWKSLNNVYGEYFYADLTRDDNIKRKEEVIKNIDFNLKRISGLDLSLSQNIDQASQVFKPFYEDQYLMKDMAWTKNFGNQLGRAEGLKNSDDQERRSRYWDDGVRAMNYMREEFRNASAEESLGFANAEYTPYVNVNKLAGKVAKEAGLNIESVQFSPDGRWIVKKTNGEQLIEPLSKLFEAELGNDPAVQAVYKTEAYLARKDYAYSNAAQFGGNEAAAEMKYLEDSFNMLKEQSKVRFEQLKDMSKTYDANIADIKKQIENGTASPTAKRSLAEYEYAKRINDGVISRVERDNEMLNGDEDNVTRETSGFINPYGDVKSLRFKVDNGMATNLMQKDIDEAAQIFAYKNAKVDMDANPYAVNDQKHAQAMQQIHTRGNYTLRAVQMRNKGEKEANMDKLLVERGSHQYDTRQFLEDGSLNPSYMRAIPVESQNVVFTVPNDEGGVTDKLNSKYMDAKINRMKSEAVLPQVNNMISLMNELVGAGNMSAKEANDIFGMNYKSFARLVNQNPTGFLVNKVGDKELVNINKRLNSWISTKGKDLSAMNSETYKNFRNSSVEFQDYTNYVKKSQDWKRNTSIQVEKELARQGVKYSYLLYDNDGNLRSKQEYYNLLLKNKKISGKDLELFKANLTKEALRKGISGISEAIGTPGGNNQITSWIGQAISNIDKVGPGNWIDRAFEKSFTSDIDYDTIVRKASSVYTSGKVKGDVEGLAGLKGMKGTGKFAPDASAILVNTKAFDTKGMAHWGEVLSDLKNFDFKDTKNNKVSLTGSGVNAFTTGPARNEFGQMLLGMIQAETAKNMKENKLGMFRLEVKPIAGGDVKKSAVTIHLDPEYLKQFVYKVDKDKNKIGPGVLSPDAYDAAVQNGVTYIMDSKNMRNTMYKNAYSTPLQSFIDSGNKYTYEDPLNSDRNFVIEQGDLGTGGYKATGSFPLMNPETGQTELVNFPAIYGTDPVGMRSEIMSYFDLNNSAFRGQ